MIPPSSLVFLQEGVARLSFTARIERAQFQRARSASKKGTWSLPPHLSEAARCASTKDHQAPSPPLLLCSSAPGANAQRGVVPIPISSSALA